MEVKNRREDLFTQNLPPTIKTPSKTLLLSSDYWKETAGSYRSKDYDLTEFDYILVSTQDMSHEYAIGILPTDFIKGKTAARYLQYTLLEGGTYFSISYYRQGYWDYNVNQIYNKTVNVYGIKL